MGQTESTNSNPTTMESIAKQVKSITEITSITYAEFLKHLSDINSISSQCMAADGNQLKFVVQRGSDSTLFWKGTVRIACIRYNNDKQLECCRLFNLQSFIKICKIIQKDIETAQQIDKNSANNILDTFNGIVEAVDESDGLECCICFENLPNMMLPCAHSYCKQCIDSWNVIHNTCPICREVMKNENDEWVLSDAPNSAEINEYIAKSLMDIADN